MAEMGRREFNIAVAASALLPAVLPVAARPHEWAAMWRPGPDGTMVVTLRTSGGADPGGVEFSPNNWRYRGAE